MKIPMKLPVKLLAILILALPLSVPAAPDDEHYGEADLDQMLAPIALYPDSVLSQVLIASTYPLEVAQAARWSRQHSSLKGEDAVDAVEGKDWDISVKALVAFPEILDRMDEDLDWTQRLGEAFLAQEGEVMDRVQLLRQRAHAAGNLDSNEQVRVVREREIIYIEPAYRHRIFVPYYDPWVIYGNWWWPAYPPYCWSTWGGHSARYYNSYSPSYYWGVGFNVSPVFYFSGFHWRNRHVVVFSSNRHTHPGRNSNWNYSAREFHRQRDTQRWQHDTRHRRGVDYRSERLSQDHGRMRRDAVQREQQLSRQPSSTNRRESQREGPQQQRDQRDNPQRSNRSHRAEPARSESPVREEPPQRSSQRRDADRRANEPRQERRSDAERGEPTRSEPQSREEPQRNGERHATDHRANEPRQERRSGAERGERAENPGRENQVEERERSPHSGNNRGEERQKGGSRQRSER